MSIQQLREERTAKAKEYRLILDNNPGKLSEENAKKLDELEAQITDVENRIKREEKILELESENIENEQVGEGLAAKLDNHERKLLAKWLRGGDSALSAEEWQSIRNTMSTTTGSQGGYTVPTIIASKIIDAMKAYGAMRTVAEIIRTEDGKPLNFPGSDGTAETGEWIDQNATATALDPSFTTVPLNVFKASSKIVAIPFELLQDSTIDVESFVVKRIGQRLGRLFNTAFTVGVGTTQPDGIVAKASSGKVGTTGQTTTIIYDDVIDLIHSVDPSYRGTGCSFMASDSLLKVIRKLKDSAGRPLWTPSYDAGIRIQPSISTKADGGYASQATPIVFDYLMGYPVWVNNDMAVPAANAKSMIFGDLSYYKIRDAMDITLFRFTDSAYAKLGQVAFLAWARTGGNLVDTNAVKFYQHSAT